MNRRYINYSRSRFRNWKDRVKKYLPLFVRAFYSIEGHIDYDKHKLLGKVILGINDPFYSLVDSSGEHYSYDTEYAMEILLELNVNELFSFIKKRNPKMKVN